jgi:hypothetical protein
MSEGNGHPQAPLPLIVCDRLRTTRLGTLTRKSVPCQLCGEHVLASTASLIRAARGEGRIACARCVRKENAGNGTLGVLTVYARAVIETWDRRPSSNPSTIYTLAPQEEE